ncbi:hypothetical protein OH77DRAFT_1587289 [Trametes cingulata]|nr:hypothetical protein OH77DRAFT_1587289 [Trametes cingulata]
MSSSAMRMREPQDMASNATTMHTAGLTLHTLPAEVIERVLIFSDPRDVSRYAQTCRFARKLVYEPKDGFLWRELYLGRPFDDLRKAVPAPRPRLDLTGRGRAVPERTPHPSAGSSSWRWEVQRRTEAEAIAAAAGECDAETLYEAFETFLAALDTALPVKQEDTKAESRELSSRSENLRWLDRVLRRTKVLNVAIPPPPAPSPVPAASDASLPSSSTSSSAPASSPGYPGTVPRRELRPSRDRLRDDPLPSARDSVAAEAHQLLCRLRAYVALAHESSFSADARVRMAELRKASRCFVYDMRRYQPGTLWGPYRVVYAPVGVASTEPHPGTSSGEEDSGSDLDEEEYWGGRVVAGKKREGETGRRTLVVNWEHIDHIMNVVGLKLREVAHTCLGYYKKPLFSLEALRPYSAVGSFEPDRQPHDWAGVTGKWRRFVCFMDYRDLYMFNYSHLPPGPHHASFFEDPFDEALRPVELHLSLISEGEYFADVSQIPHVLPRVPPASDVGDPAFPTLYFEGHSRGPHSSAATIRGKVSTLADGAIRWQFVTTYDGRMQWSAEGVQLGHVCSAAGIAGIWTGAHHERDDPAGPFWMVKVDDELPHGILNTLH